MEYLLKSMGCLLVLLLIHRLLLQREVLHRFNRFYLLAAVLGSFLIPLYTIEVEVEKPAPILLEAEPVAESEDFGYEEFSTLEETLPTGEVIEVAAAEPVSDFSFPWEKAAWIAYFLVSAVFLFRFAKNLTGLLRQIRSNPHLAYRDETLVLHRESQSPFSFLRYIFVSRHSFEQVGISDAVFAHEQCHVRERHSWDVLLIEALLVPFWFHPGLYLARHAIRLNHEFIADQAALGTTPVKEYQQLLLSILSANSAPALVSSLNFSLTKKRMKMMNKKPNSPLKWLKLLVLVPVIGALVYFFGEKVEVQPEEAVVAEIQTSETENLVEKVETNIRIISDRLVEVDGESVPIETLAKWLDEIKASQPIIRFSAAPGVEMGTLADVQEILRGMEIRRVVYDKQGHEWETSGEERDREEYYRHAYFLVEDENMDYSRKSYGQLTEEEKKPLFGPFMIKPTGSPDPAMYEKWKDKETYAIWIDGAVTENAKLNDYTPADFGSFLQSRVMKNALSERFPQPFQVHMYTQKYYREADPPKPLTDQDTITLTQRRATWHKDIQKYPDPTTAYLQKNARYEKLRTSGTIYIHKSSEEKALLDELYRELRDEYSKATDRRKKNLKEPITPDSDLPRNGGSGDNGISKVAYQLPGSQNALRSFSQKDLYYKNATFFVEDTNGEFVQKDYGDLSSEEKSYLIAPAKSPAYRTPTPEMLNSWRNAKEYAIWLDGEPISNNKVANQETDIVFYFSSFFPTSERTATYPQAYKIRMFSKEGYEEIFGAKSGFASPLVEDDIFYLYPLTKRVNYGRTITKSNQSPIDMYLRLYDSYANGFEDKGEEELSEWQQAIGWQMFTELGGRYYRLSAANKKMVPRAKRPEFQYWVPLMKDGVRYYKKQNELTEEEKKQLPPPPPPPSKSEGGVAPSSSDKKQVVAVGNKWAETTAYRLVNDGGFQSNALKEYLTRYGQFQTKAYENHGFSQKSAWEIEALRLDFDQLVKSYERLTNDERRSVQRASFPYAKIEKDGKTIYKKFAELSEQERKELAC